MLTRGEVTHSYYPMPCGRVNTPGIIRVQHVKGIPQSWAITRPGSAPAPSGAPWYITPHQPNILTHGGRLALSLTAEHVEMDPSDPTTWRRTYRFT